MHSISLNSVCFSSTFEQSWDIWTSWRLFNIIVIICDVHFEILLYIFEVFRTVMHYSAYFTSKMIRIILNNLQLVHLSKL